MGENFLNCYYLLFPLFRFSQVMTLNVNIGSLVFAFGDLEEQTHDGTKCNC